MDTIYERWLIARGNVFLPASASVAKIVEELRAASFIVDPSTSEVLGKLRFDTPRSAHAKQTGGYAVTTVENTFAGDALAAIQASTEAQPARVTAEWLDDADRDELRLVWPVSGDVGLKFPLSMRPDDVSGGSYALEVHRAPEYVYPLAPTIGRLPTKCACGDRLDFEWDVEEVVPAFLSSKGIFAECDACSRTFDPSKGSAKLTNPFDETTETVPGGAAYRFAIKVVAAAPFVRDARLAFAPELVALVEKAFGRSFYEVGALSDGDPTRPW